jgi:hypothetical protein
MFRKYEFRDSDGVGVDFFVHSKKTRNGFMHRACVIGPLPRLDEKDNDWDRYRRNEDILSKKRVAKVSYINRTWESYPGQTCLRKLWDQLAELDFVDMSEISEVNPFDSSRAEPEGWDMFDPEELFGRFRLQADRT